MCANWSEVLGPRVGVGAGVDEDGRAPLRRDHDGDPGAVNAGQPPDVEQRRRQHRARVPGGDDGVGVTVADRADGATSDEFGLRPHGLGGVLVHRDRLGRLDERKPVRVEGGGPKRIG